MLPSSGIYSPTVRWFLARLIFYPEDGGETCLRIIGPCTDYMTMYCRWQQSGLWFVVVIGSGTWRQTVLVVCVLYSHLLKSPVQFWHILFKVLYVIMELSCSVISNIICHPLCSLPRWSLPWCAEIRLRLPWTCSSETSCLQWKLNWLCTYC
jgi:hypothetical protein